MRRSSGANEPRIRRPGKLCPAVLAACVLAGCHAATPTTQPDEGVINTRTASSLINEGGPVFNKPPDGSTGAGIVSEGGTNLINEGGPVFNNPTGESQFQIDGQVLTPHYYTGGVNGLTVTAEHLNGVTFPDVAASQVLPGGYFTIKGPATDKYFFASASFNFEDTTHTVRALAQAASTDKLVIDTASSLVAAKVSLVAQRRQLFNIDYQETQDLTDQVRAKVGGKLESVRLDVAAQELSNALDVLASKDDALQTRLKQWQYTLDPTFGASTPAPMTQTSPAPTAGSPSPIPTAVPSSGAPPGK